MSDVKPKALYEVATRVTKQSLNQKLQQESKASSRGDYATRIWFLERSILDGCCLT